MKHAVHLQLLFDCLEKHGLVVKPSNCIFGVASVVFLGHHVNTHGVTPLPSCVDAISAFPCPSTVKAMQEFVGMMNFYHRFIPAASRILRPLFATAKGKSTDVITWTEEMVTAFESAKMALATATLLHHPVEGAETALVVDAFSTALGGILQRLMVFGVFGGFTATFYTRQRPAILHLTVSFSPFECRCIISVTLWKVGSSTFLPIISHSRMPLARSRMHGRIASANTYPR